MYTQSNGNIVLDQTVYTIGSYLFHVQETARNTVTLTIYKDREQVGATYDLPVQARVIHKLEKRLNAHAMAHIVHAKREFNKPLNLEG